MSDDQLDQETQEAVEQILDAKQTIISQLGLEEASEDQKAQVLENMDRRVAVAITEVILKKASPEEAETIRVGLEQNGNLETKVADIVSKNPELQNDIRKALADLWDKILNEAEAARG